jgi:hypothetical protein
MWSYMPFVLLQVVESTFAGSFDPHYPPQFFSLSTSFLTSTSFLAILTKLWLFCVHAAVQKH